MHSTPQEEWGKTLAKNPVSQLLRITGMRDERSLLTHYAERIGIVLTNKRLLQMHVAS